MDALLNQPKYERAILQQGLTGERGIFRGKVVFIARAAFFPEHREIILCMRFASSTPSSQKRA